MIAAAKITFIEYSLLAATKRGC